MPKNCSKAAEGYWRAHRRSIDRKRLLHNKRWPRHTSKHRSSHCRSFKYSVQVYQKGLVHAGCLVTLYLLLQTQALLLAHAPAGFSPCFKSPMALLILKAQLQPIGAPWDPLGPLGPIVKTGLDWCTKVLSRRQLAQLKHKKPTYKTLKCN
jgi:hypothetical protein